MTHEHIRHLEEMSLNAGPAIQQVLYDGWIARFSGGYTRRGNSVQPLYPGTVPLPEKIAFCESLYQRHNLPTVFKMTAASLPAELDSVLATLGYAETARTSVQTREIVEMPQDPSLNLRIWNALDERWLSAFSLLRGTSPESQARLRAILGAIAVEARFLALERDGEVQACGLGVIQSGWLGLFDLVTHPQLRRQGLGAQLITALFNDGYARGARQAYLQVDLTNQPALALYRRLGFVEAYQYWYRVKDLKKGG